MMIQRFVVPACLAGSPMGRFGRRIGLPLQFVDSFFHFLAGLERHHKLFWDKDFLTCPGIASLPSRPPFYLEHAKIPQFDPLLINQRFDDGIECLLDDLLRLELGESNLLGDGLYDLFFGHDESPVRRPRSGQSALAPDEITVPCGFSPLVPSVIGARVSVKILQSWQTTYDHGLDPETGQKSRLKVAKLSKNAGPASALESFHPNHPVLLFEWQALRKDKLTVA